jgi:hypothetical protein
VSLPPTVPTADSVDLTPIEKAAFELSLQLEMVSHCRLAQAYRSGQVAYARLLVRGKAVGALLLARTGGQSRDATNDAGHWTAVQCSTMD